MFVIVDGRLQVVRTMDGKDQVLAERGPGDFVGEMAIIESVPRSATLRTQTEVRLLAIDAETFKGILRERPNLSDCDHRLHIGYVIHVSEKCPLLFRYRYL